MADNGGYLRRRFWRMFHDGEIVELDEVTWLLYADGLDPVAAIENGFTSRFGAHYWTTVE